MNIFWNRNESFKKKSKQCCNKFDIEINKDILNKFKNVLGLKKVIIVLINCLMQKDIYIK